MLHETKVTIETGTTEPDHFRKRSRRSMQMKLCSSPKDNLSAPK